MRNLFIVLVTTLLVGLAQAQTPAKAAAAGAKAPAGMKVESSLIQLMRGIFYPSSNVIFFAQSEDPAKVPPGKDAATATDPLQNAYGKWEAVENASLAIADGANLLTLAGRKCANGRPVPIGNADWPKFVAEVRAAGLTAYKAAQAKDQDKILDAAEVLTTACSNCHDKYREVADRCK